MHGTSAELRPSSDLSLALRPFHLPRGRERKRKRERERERELLKWSSRKATRIQCGFVLLVHADDIFRSPFQARSLIPRHAFDTRCSLRPPVFIKPLLTSERTIGKLVRSVPRCISARKCFETRDLCRFASSLVARIALRRF